MKHIFIINSESKYFKQSLIDALYNACVYLNLDFEITIAGTKLDLIETVEKHKYDKAIIYAVGEDSEINCILNVLINGTAKLGIIPLGQINNIYRSLDEYQSREIKCNVMKVNDKYGLNIFSMGLGSLISANAKSSTSKISSKLNQISTFLGYKYYGIGINNYFERLLLLAICNGAYKNGYKLSSKALLHRPDVQGIKVNEMSKLSMLLFGLDLINNNHEQNPHTKLFTANKEIQIETSCPVQAELDGEIMQDDHFVITPNASTIEVVNNRPLIRKLTK